MNWLSRIRSEPQSAPAGPVAYQWPPPVALHSPITPQTAAKTRDPNAADYRYQVNQKCIYERELPGGSYITAHLQRLQAGFYDSDVIHEARIENVRFVAINFVFHPSRKDYRFKSAEISIALHHTKFDSLTRFDRVRNSLVPEHHSENDHGTQTDTVWNALVRSTDAFPIPRPQPKASACHPKFIRHAPHLLFGSISPETLDWNFNLAGSVGVSQGPASAAFKPSYGMKGSYKLYEMMRIQGSVRTLRSWFGHEYNVEDGELVWTLEENRLQKSGLPREFSFVMLLTKGSGGFEPSDDVTLDIDIHPKVSGPMGGTYPSFITGLHRFQPFRKEQVNLDEEVGQVFEPCLPGRGFNFANLASNFDDFVWLPGTTYSTTDSPQPQVAPASNPPQTSTPQQPKQITSQPTGDTTLNLRVFLENARGSPAPMSNNQNHFVLPNLHLRPPSRNPSPLPPSITGSHRSNRRSITITSQAPASTVRSIQRHSYAPSSSQPQSRNTPGASTGTQSQTQQVSHSHSLRKTRSRSGLDKEYVSSESPREIKTQSQTFHDAHTGISPPTEGRMDAQLREPKDSEENRDRTPRHGDEDDTRHLQPQIDEINQPQSQSQSRTPTQLQPGYSTPPPREQRFPSLAYSYEETPPASKAEIYSSPTIAKQTIKFSDASTEAATKSARTMESLPTSAVAERGAGNLTALPQVEAPAQHSNHHAAQNQSQHQDQDQLDPSTPSWHQHSHNSSVSPPSTNAHTNPNTHISPQPISHPRSSLDKPPQENWNDTPPEWASPSISGTNTPTRNRSLRTRKATAKALAVQDQLERNESLRASRKAAGNGLGVGRSASLRISASPSARDRETESGAGRGSARGGVGYSQSLKHDPVSMTDRGTGAGATSASAPRADAATVANAGNPRSFSQRTSGTVSSNGDAERQTKGAGYFSPSATATGPATALSHEPEEPPTYTFHSNSRATSKYTAEQQRQIQEMERDSNANANRSAGGNGGEDAAALAQRYGREAGYWGHDPQPGEAVYASRRANGEEHERRQKDRREQERLQERREQDRQEERRTRQQERLEEERRQQAQYREEVQRAAAGARTEEAEEEHGYEEAEGQQDLRPQPSWQSARDWRTTAGWATNMI